MMWSIWPSVHIRVLSLRLNLNVGHAVGSDVVTQSKCHWNGDIAYEKIFAKNICNMSLPASKKTVLCESKAIRFLDDRHEMREVDVGIIKTLTFFHILKMVSKLTVHFWPQQNLQEICLVTSTKRCYTFDFDSPVIKCG